MSTNQKLEWIIERASKGRFVKLHLIGYGLSRVYEAQDTIAKAAVAIKVGSAANPEVREQLQREYEALVKIGDSPNIIRTLGFEVYDGRPCLILELAEQSLGELLDDGKQFSIDRAIEIAEGVARGLAVIHDAGYIHRDIHPKNILFDAAGTVKVSDFGLAQKPSQTTRSTHGALAYIAPEQIVAEGMSAFAQPQSDIYATGAVLYRLVTGNMPFTEGSEEGLARQKRDRTYVERTMQEIAPPLSTIVMKCLEPQIENRYQSANELLQALIEAKSTMVPRNAAATSGKVMHDAAQMGSTDDVSVARDKERLLALEGETAQLRADAELAAGELGRYAERAHTEAVARKRAEERARTLEARLETAQINVPRTEEPPRTVAETPPTSTPPEAPAPLPEEPIGDFVIRYRAAGNHATDVFVQLRKEGLRDKILAEIQEKYGVEVPIDANQEALGYNMLREGNILYITPALVIRYGRRILEEIMIPDKTPTAFRGARPIGSEEIYEANRREPGDEKIPVPGEEERRACIPTLDHLIEERTQPKPWERHRNPAPVEPTPPKQERKLDLPYRVRYTTANGKQNPEKCDGVYVEIEQKRDAVDTLDRIAFAIYGMHSAAMLSYWKARWIPQVELRKGVLIDVTPDILEQYGQEMLRRVALSAAYLPPQGRFKRLGRAIKTYLP